MVPSPLRLARFQRGLAQASVAEAVGADQTTVSLVELGYRLWGPTFEKLAIHYVEDPQQLRRRMLAWCRQVGRSTSGTPNGKPRAAA